MNENFQSPKILFADKVTGEGLDGWVDRETLKTQAKVLGVEARLSDLGDGIVFDLLLQTAAGQATLVFNKDEPIAELLTAYKIRKTDEIIGKSIIINREAGILDGVYLPYSN